MSTAAIEVHRWTREDYEFMVLQGLLGPETKVELIDGIIYDMAPQKSGHATGVTLAQQALFPVLPAGFFLRIQLPLALGDYSEPEPDVAVISGDPRDFSGSHPTTAALIVEVADASLDHDRTRKRRLYAREGIPEYWLLNTTGRQLEVCRDPQGGTYQFQSVLLETDCVSPLLAPQTSIRVGDLLP